MESSATNRDTDVTRKSWNPEENQGFRLFLWVSISRARICRPGDAAATAPAPPTLIELRGTSLCVAGLVRTLIWCESAHPMRRRHAES